MLNSHKNRFIDKLKSYHLNNPGKSRLLISLFVILLLLTIIRAALPQTIIYNANAWLKQQGIESTISDIKINLLDGSFSLLNARGYKNNKLLFEIGLVDIHWQWKPLSKKTIAITKIALDTININIAKYTNKLIVGGVHFDPEQNNSKVPDDTQNSSPWAASLGAISLNNLNVCYLQHSESYENISEKTRVYDYCASLKELSWDGTVAYDSNLSIAGAEDLPLVSTGELNLNELTLTDNKLGKNLVKLSSNSFADVAITGLNNIQIGQVSFNDFSALQRDDNNHPDTIHFQLLSLRNIELTRMEKLHIHDISINKPGIHLVKQSPALWEYQQWIPSQQKETTSDNGNTKSTPPATGITVDNITINEFDSCYIDKSTSQHFCLVFQTFEWNGNIQYNASSSDTANASLLAKGDITFLQPNIRDHIISRNLLNFSSLILSELELDGPGSAAFRNLKLDDIRALQRSEDSKDSSVTVNDLDVENVRYSQDSLSINTVSINGIASNISKNKDGDWEHNKWLDRLASNAKQPEVQKADNLNNKNNFDFSINNLNITTDKEIAYTDNSTDPVMKTGLQAFTFDLKELNTALPDNNSSFSLSAKSDHHSTINVNGTARPFADKISFDATGELKGFDLRTASPVTRQAIGHIIKSGQMNADLKLLAVDGKLDSNIALSLYQFNIKSMNKDAADKLDKLFGMPLNQTLVLLRDKDDSINLDIPITGDVTSPSFNPMDAIIKATSKAATVTLITFYTPYGLVYAGGSTLFNIATALNFEPVIFTPGSSVLQDNNKQQLEKLTRLLTEKPNIRLTLCGTTNNHDLYALYPELKKDTGIKATEIKPTKIQSEALEKLASDRQTNSKNYLINKLNVSHDRLILCAPEHNSQDNALAGVEINI